MKKINVTLPKDVTPEDVTLDMAVALIAEKAAKSGKRKAPAKKEDDTEKDGFKIGSGGFFDHRELTLASSRAT